MTHPVSFPFIVSKIFRSSLLYARLLQHISCYFTVYFLRARTNTATDTKATG